MLKWVLRWAVRAIIIACALLALGISIAAGMHWKQGRFWVVRTPKVAAGIIISPQDVSVVGHLRGEFDVAERGKSPGGRYRVAIYDWNNADTRDECEFAALQADFSRYWHGFGVYRGYKHRAVPSDTGILCPTWFAIAVLLLPSGLWAILGWRQRRRAIAGRCVGCGYDLRASPERCPECGRAVWQNAEVRMRNAER